MGRGKIKHKSTAIDMTAMCDVAFLLLSFFILTAQFKPSEAIPVTVPSSVGSIAAQLNSDAFVVSIDQGGKVYVELSDAGIRDRILQKMQALRGFELTPAQQKQFRNTSLIPVPVASLPDYLALNPDQLKKTPLPGIPMDSTGGELKDWITAGLQAYNNDTRSIHFIIKGDYMSKFPNVNNVFIAFKRNEVYKFQLLTTPQGVPPGSELYKKELQQGGTNPDEE